MGSDVSVEIMSVSAIAVSKAYTCILILHSGKTQVRAAVGLDLEEF